MDDTTPPNTTPATPETSTEPANTPEKAASKPVVYPWRRLFARWLDSYLLMFPVMLVLMMMLPSTPEYPDMEIPLIVVMVLSLPVWLLLEPTLLALWGTTPGKWLWGIRVETADGDTPSFGKALVRTLWLWVIGLALCIPIANLITCFLSKMRLEETGATFWDQRGNLKVIHTDHSTRQMIGAILLVAFIIFSALPS